MKGQGAFSAAMLAAALAIAGSARAVEHDKGCGEPYALAGNRIVFTTWYLVYPGRPDWRDASGDSVYASRDKKLGPREAFFNNEDRPTGIEFVVEKAERLGPVIRREKPWEAVGIAPLTLLKEGGAYRLWARCEDRDGDEHNCCFESADGVTWTRPSLGLEAFDGSKDNNLFPGKPIGPVFVDPVAVPEERYKTLWHGDFDPDRFERDYKLRRPYSQLALEADPGRVHSMRAAVSPDGVRWTDIPDPVSVEHCDTAIVGYYDEQRGKYVAYTRTQMGGPRAPGFPAEMQTRRHHFSIRRAIGRTETTDFREFPLSTVIVEPGTDMKPTDAFYTNCRTTIPGAPDHHLIFPAIYHLADDTTSIELWTSYDGLTWHRAPGGYLAETGAEGAWDGGCVFALPNLTELPGGDWVLPYVGYVYPHKYPRGAWNYDVGLMRWPKGRLMALEAKEKGEFTTVAFVAPGERLHVNAVTKRAGSVLVEACDFNGKPLEGRSFADAVPIIGDQYGAQVVWKGSDTLGVKEGEPLVLRFRLDKARMYALDFE